ncbi:unannotated protein [freshwater metagenome]|uniref:Unannotated protein n=1 Tax=freshwater metagenome TaxID=449393 RepID=A0A6J7JUR0_9ZZZZ
MPRLLVETAANRSCSSSGNDSSEPTGRISQRPRRPNSSTVEPMISMSAFNSSGDRFRLSFESSHKVTTFTFVSSHQSSSSMILSAPALWPRREEVSPSIDGFAFAHLRLPSKITPTWCGVFAKSSERANRTS